MSKVWTLPSGLQVNVDGGINVKFPKAENWTALALSIDDAERLLAILNVEIPIAKWRAGKG